MSFYCHVYTPSPRVPEHSICVCVCMYVCVRAPARAPARYLCRHAHAHTYARMHTHVHTRARIQVHARACARAHTRTHASWSAYAAEGLCGIHLPSINHRPEVKSFWSLSSWFILADALQDPSLLTTLWMSSPRRGTRINHLTYKILPSTPLSSHTRSPYRPLNCDMLHLKPHAGGLVKDSHTATLSA